MPTPACLATAVIGAPGSATNTARADSRMRWSLRAASACRPLIGPLRPTPCRPGLPGRAFVSLMKLSVAGTGTNHSVLIILEQKISFRWSKVGEAGETTGESDVISIRDQEPEPRGRKHCGEYGGQEQQVALGGVRHGDHGSGDGPARLDHRAGRRADDPARAGRLLRRHRVGYRR